jgi:hypothetical protein
MIISSITKNTKQSNLYYYHELMHVKPQPIYQRQEQEVTVTKGIPTAHAKTVHNQYVVQTRPRASKYLAYAQLVEHIQKNLVILDHIILCLNIEINLQ